MALCTIGNLPENKYFVSSILILYILNSKSCTLAIKKIPVLHFKYNITLRIKYYQYSSINY